MKILFDECVPRPLRHALKPHVCVTVQELGWAGKTDAALLARSDCDVFLTTDRNLAFQQNWTQLQAKVLVLCAPTNRLTDLLPLVPEILRQIKLIRLGEVREIGPRSMLR